MPRISTRIQSFERDIALIIREELGSEAYSRAFGQAARGVIGDIDTANAAVAGRRIPYDTFVDGRASEQLETAKRVIVARWDLATDLFVGVHQMLTQKAPVLDGDYRASITLFADGEPVAVDEAPPAASEYFFASTVPYARKIERGQSPQAPDGVFESIAAVASRRYGNVARIKFSHRSILGGWIGDWASRTSMTSDRPSRNRPGPQRQEWLTRQPAIVITLR